MAYDTKLADRVRRALGEQADLEEKRMFGGLAFMVNGHMCCGIVGADLMVRVGPERYAEALSRAHVREMDFTGRPLKGMVYVDSAGLRTEAGLRGWAARALTFVEGLLPKSAKRRPLSSRRARR